MRKLAIVALSSAALTCSSSEPPPPAWKPGTVYTTPRDANARGYLDRRGLVHAHSVYSHDACDGKPETDGVRDPVCFEDFRRDLCTVKHDFVMLTDHRDAFDRTEYPDVLLHRADRGDELVERGGRPVASRAACADGHRSLILAGTEAGTMPVGLEEHVGPLGERGGIYGDVTPEAIAKLHEKGAVVLVAHTEGWTTDQLSDLPLDGFEMFNLHANTFRGMPAAIELLGRLYSKDEGLPHPDLVFLNIFSEDPIYLEKWGSVLARGHRRVTTMGTDCHRNSFPQEMSDGERVDSYRRMMGWFSNHLLVKPDADGGWDDRHLKEALRAGRLYGAFEVMGYPVGFDFRADAGGRTHELGAEVKLADAPVLRVTMPSLRDLDPKREKPALTARLLRAIDGGFEEVASGAGDLAFEPRAAGAYRAEIRIVPNHLRDDLRDDADALLAKDYVWIYSNAIYVR